MNELDYLHRRFIAEWECADLATDPRARAIHYRMAHAYLDRIERLRRPSQGGRLRFTPRQEACAVDS